MEIFITVDLTLSRLLSYLQVVQHHERERVRGERRLAGVVDALKLGPGLDAQHERANAGVKLEDGGLKNRLPRYWEVLFTWL